jgi:GNAT superfamily N-acetyltransferase
MNRGRYHFDDRYREHARLRDGTSVLLRVVRAEDRELLRRGFARLSPASRHTRFMAAKTVLTEGELDALTALDGVERFAIGALEEDPQGGTGEGLGIARFARLPAEPEVAEAAVTVVDSAQGRGLGSLLLRRLAAAARERGVRWFRGEILASNEPMRRLLADHVAAAAVEEDDDVVRVLVELPPDPNLLAPAGEPGDLLGRMLAQVARGGINVRLGDVLLKRR